MAFNGKRYTSYASTKHASNSFLLCPHCDHSILVGLTMQDGCEGTEGSEASLLDMGATTMTKSSPKQPPKRIKLSSDGNDDDDNSINVAQVSPAAQGEDRQMKTQQETDEGETNTEEASISLLDDEQASPSP